MAWLLISAGALTAAALLPRASALCYGAFVPDFTWCSGYAKAGYNCSGGDGTYCSSSACLADSCFFCAVEYTDAVPLPASGRCCTSLGPNGECVQPLPALPPWNEAYLWPDHHPALIVEGPAAYERGPHVWSNGSAFNESGAYAFTFNSPSGRTDSECPPLPTNTTFDTTKVWPISLRAHGVGISNCALRCNWTAVQAGEPDPCAPGSVSRPDVSAPMRCYWGGPGWLHGPDVGVCGYNCTALHPDTGALCDADDVQKDECEVFCDSRYFPGANGTMASRRKGETGDGARRVVVVAGGSSLLVPAGRVEGGGGV
jgi:hypothetical protein